MDEHRRRARVHDRPPGQPLDARHDPRAYRHGDRRLGRPRLGLRRLPAVPRQAARVSPQPPRQAGEDARPCSVRWRRRAGRGRRGLLDGGRHRAAVLHLRSLRALRRAADGRRGSRRGRAGRTRRWDRRAPGGRGSRRPTHGHLLQVLRLLRRLRRGAGGRDRESAGRRWPSSSPAAAT